MPNGVQYWTGLGDEPKPTLQAMDFLIQRAAVQPWTLEVARMVTRGARTPLEEAKAVWAAVKQRIMYRSDPVDVEWIQDPTITWGVTRTGDCDDMAVVAGSLLAALGHKVTGMAVQWQGRAVPSHAVLQDVTAGVIVDPVTVEPGIWPPRPVEKLVRV